MKSFLKVPQKAHHGLLIVSELAEHHSDGRPLSLDEIAQKSGISRKFLEEVAGLLRKAGIIEGRRGAAGGYLLKIDPYELTVAEVMAAIEGPVALVDCLKKGVSCPMAAECNSYDVWSRVQGQINDTLSQMTIADVIKDQRLAAEAYEHDHE